MTEVHVQRNRFMRDEPAWAGGTVDVSCIVCKRKVCDASKSCISKMGWQRARHQERDMI
jgi:hypothetical protein